MTTLDVGARLGRFVLLQELGADRPRTRRTRGYLALDRASLEEVVLHLPDSERLPGDEGARAAFGMGLDAARRVSAPGVAKVLSGGVLEGRWYLCSQWVAGAELDHLLRQGPLSLEASLRILWEVAGALSAMHGAGAVHGDLCPANIVLTTEGVPVLVGHVPTPIGGPASSSRESERVARYTPPEWSTTREASPAGDVYALGLIAYELLVGRRLLPEETAAGHREAQAKLQASLDAGARFSRRIPEPLAEVLMGMLATERQRRPRLEEDFVAALVEAAPGGSLKPRLDEILGPPLSRAVQTRRGDLLRQTDRALEGQRLLPAASCLARFSELWPLPEERLIEQGARRIRECLWRSLSIPAGGGAEDPDVVRGEALAGQLFKASFNLGLSGLISICRHRLAAYTHRESPMAALLPDSGERAELRARRPALCKYLRAHPDHQNALLGLAITTPDLEPDPRWSSDRTRAELLERNDLPAAALHYAARELQATPDDPDLLVRLHRLATRALEATRPAAGDDAGDEGALLPVPSPPSQEDLEVGTGPRGAGVFEDAEVLFTKGQILINEGKLAEAAECFSRLVDSGSLEEEHFHGVVCKEVQRMLWTALTRELDGTLRAAGLARILALAIRLDLQQLLPLCTRLALTAGAEAGEDPARLLAVLPGSPILLEAAAARDAIADDVTAQVGHLLELAERLVERGEADLATRHLETIRALGAGGERPAALARRIDDSQVHTQLAEAEFQRMRLSLPFQDPEDALLTCEAMVQRYPQYVPALLEASRRAARAGDMRRCARHAMEVGKRQFLRGELSEARESFRSVIRAEPENHEALLYIAALVPPEPGSARDLLALRVELLCREELFEAAIHLARRQLRGSPKDLPVYDLLVRTCRRAGGDPSPYLIAQGHLMVDEDPDLARDLFYQAVQETSDRERAVDALLRSGGIQGLFSPTELMRLRG